MGRLEPVNPYITGSILVYLCSYVCTYNTSLTSTCRCACVLLKLSNLIVQLCSVYVCVSGSVHLPFFTTETEELTVMVCLLNMVHFIQNWSVIIIYAPISRSLHKTFLAGYWDGSGVKINPNIIHVHVAEILKHLFPSWSLPALISRYWAVFQWVQILHMWTGLLSWSILCGYCSIMIFTVQVLIHELFCLQQL